MPKKKKAYTSRHGFKAGCAFIKTGNSLSDNHNLLSLDFYSCFNMISGFRSVPFSCFKVRFCSAELCHSLISCAGKTCCLERLFMLLINLLPSLWLLSKGKFSAMSCCYLSKHSTRIPELVTQIWVSTSL